MWGLSETELEAIRISLKVTTVAVILILPMGLVMGWLLARYRFPGKLWLEMACMLPLVLPPVVVGYLLLVVFGRGGFIGRRFAEFFGWQVSFTWLGASLACAVVSFPLLVRSVKLGFLAFDPRLELMARSLGAGRLRTFVSVSVPLCAPAIVSGVLLAFARGWGEFGATIMVAGNIPGQTRTVPLAIYGAMERPGGMEQAWRLTVVSIVVAALSLVVSEWLGQRRLKEIDGIHRC